VFETAVLRRICGVTRRDRRRNVDIVNKLVIERDIVELLQIRRLTYFRQCFECSLRDIRTFFFMDISLEVDLKEDPGKSGLTISRSTAQYAQVLLLFVGLLSGPLSGLLDCLRSSLAKSLKMPSRP